MYYKNSKQFIILLVSILITSCEGGLIGNGIVLDSVTNLPLKNVVAISYVNEVNDKSMKQSMTTDSTGMFTGSTGIGGNPKHMKLYIVLSKDSFVSQTIINPTNDTVWLVRK